MSLESGRKLGQISSLLNVILPVVGVIAAVFFVLSLFASVPFGTGTVAPNPVLFSAGLITLLITMGVAGIIAYILFMVAMYRLSNYYSEPGIFKNVLYAFIINIVGGIVSVGIYFAVILSAIGSIPQTGTPSTVAPFFTQFIITYLVVIGVAFVFAIVNGLLYMRAFNKLGEKSGVDNFKTAGLLYLIGAIIPLVSWIAWIFAAIGFRKLKPSPTPTVSYPTQPLSSTMQTKRCPNCGTENSADALYCSSCGKPMQ